MARDFRPKGARDGPPKPKGSKPQQQQQQQRPARQPPASTPASQPQGKKITFGAPVPAPTPAAGTKPKFHTTFDADGSAKPVAVAESRAASRAGEEADPEPLFAAFHQSRAVGPTKAAKSGMLVPPQAVWMNSVLEPLPSTNKQDPIQLDETTIQSLRSRAQENLISDNQGFGQVLHDSGKRKEAASLGALGSLSASDARFISDLLYGSTGEHTKGGGTLSDRISALTLLIQSSPLHNLETLDKLFGMARKRSRHESGPATRAMVDWLASSGGLGGRKLIYFRDQPDLGRIAGIARSGSPEQRTTVDQRLALFAFEDELKKFYLHFLRVLESQMHDPLPFVRTAAVSHAYHLLRDQSEQEHNLLRLLVVKLGDPDRTVAAKVSSHLLSLLNAHPAMKPIVVREVAEEMQRARVTIKSDAPMAPEAAAREPKANVHAQYYGVITLNQTVLTKQDTAVATALVALYFELFDALLAQGGLDDPAEAAKAPEDDAATPSKTKPQKNRWRDSKGKGKKKGNKGKNVKDVKPVAALSATEAHGRMLSALLAGMRRAFPFAAVPQALLDKHVETLFRVTHSGSVSMAVQALQLLFQLVLARNDTVAEKDSKPVVAVQLGPLTDRFYRTLYDSLLDPRLAASNKQAMYLNLLFKAIKADPDTNRAKAMIKRLSQVLAAGMDPSFVCGALYLLSELVRYVPGLSAMLSDPEDNEPEHFVDAPDPDDQQDDDDQDPKAPAEREEKIIKSVTAPTQKTYDGKKREPRFAGAELTCWWDILPLTGHYHPSVALNARQLVQGAKVTSNGDLSLHTLTHFLDRFVYRNPKSKGSDVSAVVPLRGESAMQPSVASLRLGRDNGGGVVNLRRSGLLPSEDVRSEAFANKRLADVAPDQAFFHRYFNTKAQRDPKKQAEDQHESLADVDDSDLDSELGMDEDEVWAAMRRTLPKDLKDTAAGDAGSDQEDLAQYDYSSDEEEGDDTAVVANRDQPDPSAPGPVDDEEEEEEDDDDDQEEGDEQLDAGDVSSVSDSDSDNEMEDEDDLLPFADFEEEESKAQAGQKRPASDDDDEEQQGASLSKSQLARRERKKRKAMPTFASIDDYAHMLESDDDGNV